MSTKSMQKKGLLSIVFGLLSFVGCGQSSKTPTEAQEPSAASRPALKIWLVDAPELEKEIAVRWQAASDQSLKIESMDSRAVLDRVPFNPDIVIYPGVLLGHLVKQDAIGRLPTEALSKVESNSSQESVVFSWPVRWRNITTFGGQLYAVPLGATNLGVILRGLDPTPLEDLQKRLGDNKSQSFEHWNQFLEKTESSLPEKGTERLQMLQERLEKMNDQDKAMIVDRFLFIASTTNARSRGLFDLLKMEARLGQPEFVASARILARLARLFPDSMTAEPAKAWEWAASTSDGASFAIGWPNTLVNASDENMASANKTVVSPFAWNPCRGLIASVGRKTKQTAVSCQFLVWLADAEQRDALRSACPRVELNAEQTDRNSGREVYRAFQAVNGRDSRVEPMELSLRMANADQYRAILADHLVSAINAPDKIDEIMANCSTKWNELTAKFGVDNQRISEEQSLGYRK